MNWHSIKTRFMGSYLSLLLLFVIQVPVLYWLIGGMSEKYILVDEAGSLRKRAAEITEILNRHILTGNEELERAFQIKKKEYGEILEALRKGGDKTTAVTGPELDKLSNIEKKWQEMGASLDKAMEYGDGMRVSKNEVEASTAPMIESLSAVSQTTNGGYASLAALEKTRALKVSYLFERYLTSHEDKEALSTEIKENVLAFDETLKAFKNGAHGPVALASVNRLEETWGKRRGSILEGLRTDDLYHKEIKTLIETHTPQMVAYGNELTKTISANARNSAMSGLVLLIVSVIISGAIAVFFMWLANTQMIGPILNIKKTVEGLAGGDLSARSQVKIKFMGREIKDEISSLGESVDLMASQMSEVIGRIADSSTHLASASEQLSASSANISEGAERQSSQTAHVATAMEEMNATVVEVARNSQQASESARNAKDTAARGGHIVTEAIMAMKEVAESTSVTAETIKKLGKSSEEIGAIVSVINDIADQTNLLALNAAIEAARAGEQGRGFAVVADEVRKLAERTTRATKEISGMINTIQEETTKAVEAMDAGAVKVENGVKLANEAGEALTQIVSGVEDVTDMIGHIATSAEEQSATTDEITRNMDSIAEVAKTNVAAIGEVAKATGDLAELASELRSLVAKFRISGEAEVADFSSAKSRQLHLVKDSVNNLNPAFKALKTSR